MDIVSDMVRKKAFFHFFNFYCIDHHVENYVDTVLIKKYLTNWL